MQGPGLGLLDDSGASDHSYSPLGTTPDGDEVIEGDMGDLNIRSPGIAR